MLVTIEEKKNTVRELRKTGKTFSEISRETGILKGTISRWLSGVIFDAESFKKISEHQKEQRARAVTKSRLSKDMQKKLTEHKSLLEAKRIFEKNKSIPLFIAGISLYWAEGSNKNKYFQYSASDGEKVTLMLDFLSQYLKVSGQKINFRLFTPLSSSRDNLSFWAKYTGSVNKIKITTYETENKRKKSENKGFLQILYYDISLQQKLIFWQKLLFEHYRKK